MEDELLTNLAVAAGLLLMTDDANEDLAKSVLDAMKVITHLRKRVAELHEENIALTKQTEDLFTDSYNEYVDECFRNYEKPLDFSEYVKRSQSK